MSSFSRRQFLGALGVGAAGTLLPQWGCRAQTRAAAPVGAAGKKLNVLFIAVDDLRPQLGAYGVPGMKTTHLDALAAQGRLFERHYAQVPTCGASRASLMTGRYPVDPVSYGNGAFELLSAPDAPPTLPGQFRAAGYHTTSIGKVSHYPGGIAGGKPGGRLEMPGAWDEATAPTGQWDDVVAAYFGYADGSTRTKGQNPAFESADVPDETYADGLVARDAVAKLEALARANQPFFLATGFYRPHLPFNAPQKYWDLYQRDAIELAPYRQPPRGVDPKISMNNSGEFWGNYRHPRGARDSDDYARQVRHAYFAATSYVDAQVGKVLDALDRLGLRENTVVMVWGDHGWQLGDYGLWGKHTPYELALRSAFIARVPGQTQPGQASNALVESVDIWPTLSQLCGLDAPTKIDGQSFADVLRDARAPGQPLALGFWQQNGHYAHTLRTDRYRLIRWHRGKPDGEVAQVELYDHTAEAETRNIAEGNPKVVAQLSAQLDAELARRAAAVTGEAAPT